MIQKEIILQKPVILGVDQIGNTTETTKVTLREPTAGDLRGLSLRSLVVDSKSDDWIVLLSRISTPALPIAAINLIGMKDFSRLIAASLEMLGEDIQEQEVIQRE